MKRNAYQSKVHKRQLALYKKTMPPCVVCGTRQGITVDHIVSLKHGGSNEPSNMQPMCHRCNSRKGAGVRGWRNARI